MKNFAIPLLAASANAQRKDMEQDHAKAKPMLIADTVHVDGICVSTTGAVATAAAALKTADAELTKVTAARTALDTALGTA
jgi:hypothetical protein